MVMEQDWDLFAVVKPYISTSSTSTIATSSTPSSSGFETSTSSNFFSLYPAQQSGHIGHGGPQPPSSSSNFFSLYPSQQSGHIGHGGQQPLTMLNFNTKPFFLQPQPLSSNSFSYSSPSLKSPHIQPNQHHLHKNYHNAVSATNPKSKRRKIQPKKVCEVKAENLSSSLWAWRKYGRKSIKGSPYPREYFRCSSSRECLAKKQVEQKKSDPTIFTVTYFGEHNHAAPTHRNNLAGSTRQKPEEENATPFVIDDFFKDLGKLTGLDDILTDLDNCSEGQP